MPNQPNDTRRVVLLKEYKPGRRYCMASGWTPSAPGFAGRMGLTFGEHGWLYRDVELVAALVVGTDREQGATIEVEPQKIHWLMLDGSSEEFAAAMV